MKKLTNAKKVLVMIIMVAVMFIATNVFAADSGWETLDVNSSSTPTTTSVSPSPSSSPTTNNTTNTGTNNTTLNTTLAPTNKTNTSSYNSTNLPDTGIEDSLPAVALIVVVAISAAYAYKKVKDYQNI